MDKIQSYKLKTAKQLNTCEVTKQSDSWNTLWIGLFLIILDLNGHRVN